MRSKIGIRLVAGALVVAFGATAYSQTVVYREIFPTEGGESRKQRVRNNGWFGEQHGSVPIPVNANDQDLQISESQGSSEEDAVGNTPVGNPPPTSFAFYSPAERAGVYIGTFEFSMPIDELGGVCWETRSNAGARGPNDDSAAPQHPAGSTTESDQHLFLIVDGVTYISQNGIFVKDPNVWTKVSFDPRTILYDRYDVVNFGEPANGLKRFSGDAEDTGFSFSEIVSSGSTLEAFGLYIQKNIQGVNDSSATIRVDNFELLAAAPRTVPVTGPLGLGVLGLALAGLGGFGIRRLR